MGNHLHRPHQPEGDPRRACVRQDRSGRRRKSRSGAGRRIREGMGDPARVRYVRRSPRRPGDRSGLHLAPEHAALRMVDPRARGGQARVVREAALTSPGRGDRRVRHRRPHGPPPERGVHVPPQSANEASAAARGGRRDRRAAARALGVQLLALRPRQHPPAHRARRRRADGCRLLQRLRLAPPRRRAGPRLRRSLVRPLGHGLGLHRDASLSRQRARDLPLRHRAAEPGRARGDRQRGLALPRRSVALHVAHPRAPPRDGVERIDIEREDSYRLELENVSDAIRGESELLLGRDDAMGQAYTLEALHESATSGSRVAL